MRSLLKHLLLLAALGLATWAVVLGTWYAQRRVVGLDDVLQYLLVLPLLLFAGVLVLRKWPLDKTATPPAPSADGKAAADTADAVPSAGTGADAALPLLAAWVHTPAGADVSTLLAALAEGQPRPRPDPLLRDQDGLPMLTARIAALDLAAVQADWPAQDAPPPSPAALRALAALSPLLDQAAQALADASPSDMTGPAPTLHVLAHWPAEWSEAQAQAAQTWLAQRLSTLAPAGLAGAADLRPLRGGGALLEQAQTRLTALRRAGRDARLLLLACHSDLDDEALQRLEREGRLYALPLRPRGLMPGEAAAALLLSTRADDAPAPPSDDATSALAPVHLRALRFQPCPPADHARRPLDAAAPLQVLLDGALRACGMDAAALACLSTDADQHGDAATALYALAQSALPHLDPMDDLHLAGTCCGHTGAVAPLLALAAAWGRCAVSGTPAAALSLTGDEYRMAAILAPDASALSAQNRAA
ncbi:hypothetical protein [Azohydromonas lata]|uniref:hypothetical protein n=1 Tax=Azohydromonas lata TaxID=45677 RepID=UPI000834FCAD|nr:hypothetical protein [Azohydromonas lata]